MSLFAVYKYKTNEMHVYVIRLYKDIQLINICRLTKCRLSGLSSKQDISKDQAICVHICDIFINRKRNTFKLFDHVNTFY